MTVDAENNYLSSTQALMFDKELSDCRKSGGDCQAVIDKWKKISDEQSAIVDERLENDPLTAHGGVSTPHVIEYGRNTLPNGQIIAQSPSTKALTRPVKQDEIP